MCQVIFVGPRVQFLSCWQFFCLQMHKFVLFVFLVCNDVACVYGAWFVCRCDLHFFCKFFLTSFLSCMVCLQNRAVIANLWRVQVWIWFKFLVCNCATWVWQIFLYLRCGCVFAMHGLFGGLGPHQKLDMTAPNGLELQTYPVFCIEALAFWFGGLLPPPQVSYAKQQVYQCCGHFCARFMAQIAKGKLFCKFLQKLVAINVFFCFAGLEL